MQYAFSRRRRPCYRAAVPDDVVTMLEALKRLIVETLILNPTVQQLEFKGQQMVVAVFETFLSEPNTFLPLDARATLTESTDVARAICDHVSGMSDGFLLRTYDRLFSPRMGSVFDKV